MSKETPLVSVVMCTYNAEKYIAKAIESILAQTFRDFEFIIWDDGSNDNTKEIVSSFDDERIRYFFHENTGLGLALRLACAEAKGKYIARMDSDDICLPERLAVEINFLESHNEYVLVSSAVMLIDEAGKNIGRTFPCNDDRVLKESLLYSSLITHPMVMMRRDSYIMSGGYVSIMYCEDRVFWSRLAKFGKFYNISTPLGKYRILQNSLEHSFNSYGKVLYEFRKKMILDDVILESDIELYNCIYKKSKQHVSTLENKTHKRRKGIDEIVYQVLRYIIGDRLAELFIVNLKNIYFRCFRKTK